MKLYLLSLAVGLLVGAIYALVGVRSPAPPVVALVGLLGILVGEQLVPIVRNFVAGTPLSAAEVLADCKAHVLGELPGRAGATRMVAGRTAAGNDP
ncbi:MAG: XapX domain-containing protein [Phreatobacter sp.]